MHQGDCGTAGVSKSYSNLVKILHYLACRYKEMVLQFCRITFGIIDVLLGAANVHQCGDGDALDSKHSEENWR